MKSKICLFLCSLFFLNNTILSITTKSRAEIEAERRYEVETEREYRRSKEEAKSKSRLQKELIALKKRIKELEDQLRATRSTPSEITGTSELEKKLHVTESELRTRNRELMRQTKEKEEAVKFAKKLQGEIRVVGHRSRELKEQVQNLSKEDISKKLENIFNEITRITWLKMENVL